MKDRKNVDKGMLINKIENLNIDELNYSNFIESINKNYVIQEKNLNKNIEDKLKIGIVKYKQQADIINKIQMKKHATIESFIKYNDEFVKQTNDLKYNLKNSLLERNNLEKDMLLLLKEENKFNRILNIKKEINDINIELKNMDVSYEDLKKYNDIKNQLSQITYTIKYKDQLISNKLLLSKCIEEIKKLELSIKKIHLSQESNKKRLKEIEKNLLECDNKYLLDMIDGLEKIKTSIKKDISGNNCPVCSSDITSIDIEIEVNKNITVYKNLILKLDSITQELITSKESLSNGIELDRVNLRNLNRRLNEFATEGERLTEEIDIITENRLYREEWFNHDIESTKLIEGSIKKQIDKINRYRNLSKKVDDLENNHKEELKLIEDNSNDFADIISNLKDKLSNTERKILEMKKLEEKLDGTIDRNNKILYTLDEALLKNKYNVNINELYTELEENISYLQDKIEDIEYIHLNIKHYIFNIDIDQKVNLLERDIIQYKNSVDLIGKKVQQIDLYTLSLNEYSKKCIEEYLNNNESPVKKYYNYLNPMPIKQSLHFNTDDEEQKLLIEIKDNEKSVKRLANKTLSSGQLNVLALSIFLAMNEYQQINNLDIIAIDDPIQNMDDINQFSVCDILGSIDKQIIFSTHDIEFLKLFLKKNNTSQGNIRVFSIESPYLTPDKVKVIDSN